MHQTWLSGCLEEWRSGGVEAWREMLLVECFGRRNAFFTSAPPLAAMHMLLVDRFGLIVELLGMM